MKKWKVMLASVVLSGSILNPAFGQEAAEPKPATEEQEVVVVEGVELVESADEAAEAATAEVQTVVITDEVKVVEGEPGDEAAEAKVEVTGKIIVVGPDGKKNEYQIGDQLPEGLKILLSPNHKLATGKTMILHSESDDAEAHGEKTATVRAITVTGEEIPGSEVKVEQRLMIGVHCDVAPELLRSHLKLNDKGLIVVETVPESPAAAAGIQKDDLLLKVNDKELSAVTDLLEVVTKSEGKELSVSLMRAGDHLTIQVTPKMMEVPEQVVFAVDEGDMKMLDVANIADSQELPEHVREMLKNGPGMKRLRLITPGSIMIDKGASPEEIEKMMKNAAEAARNAEKFSAEAAKVKEQALAAHRKAIAERQVAEAHAKAHGKHKSVEQQLEELQQQINALKEQIQQADAKPDGSEEQK